MTIVDFSLIDIFSIVIPRGIFRLHPRSFANGVGVNDARTVSFP